MSDSIELQLVLGGRTIGVKAHLKEVRRSPSTARDVRVMETELNCPEALEDVLVEQLREETFESNDGARFVGEITERSLTAEASRRTYMIQWTELE
jgi:hypothetical protein